MLVGCGTTGNGGANSESTASAVGNRVVIQQETIITSEGDAEADSNMWRPRPIKYVEPIIPPNLRRQGIEGMVWVEFIINTEGIPTNIQVIESDHPELSRSAVQTIQQWRFSPGMRDGVPISVRSRVPLRFRED